MFEVFLLISLCSLGGLVYLLGYLTGHRKAVEDEIAWLTEHEKVCRVAPNR